MINDISRLLSLPQPCLLLRFVLEQKAQTSASSTHNQNLVGNGRDGHMVSSI